MRPAIAAISPTARVVWLMAAIKGARILLVEDQAVNQQVAVELLKHVQVEVKVANNGQEALALLAQGPLAAC